MENVVGELPQIPGGAGLLVDDLDAYTSAWGGKYAGHAIGVARPASAAEVSKVVSLRERNGIAVIPQGGNTGP